MHIYRESDRESYRERERERERERDTNLEIETASLEQYILTCL